MNFDASSAEPASESLLVDKVFGFTCLDDSFICRLGCLLSLDTPDGLCTCRFDDGADALPPRLVVLRAIDGPFEPVLLDAVRALDVPCDVPPPLRTDLPVVCVPPFAVCDTVRPPPV